MWICCQYNDEGVCARSRHDCREPNATPGDGQDGVDRPLGGCIGSYSALPHNAADCDGLLEVSLTDLSPHYVGTFDKGATRTSLTVLRSPPTTEPPPADTPTPTYISGFSSLPALYSGPSIQDAVIYTHVCITHKVVVRIACTLNMRPCTPWNGGQLCQQGSQLCLHLLG